MASLQNREAIEAAFGRKLGKLSARHRRELEELIGDPPNVANVTDDYWSRVEAETNGVVMTMLFLIFVISSKQHGGPPEQTQAQANTFAKTRATEISSAHVRQARARLNSAADKWNKKVAKAIEGNAKRRAKAVRRVEAAREKLRQVRVKDGTRDIRAAEATAQAKLDDATDKLEVANKVKVKPVRKSDIRAVTLTAVGPDRAQRVAVSATSLATSAGSEFGVELGKGSQKSEGDLWITAADEYVCPVCRPLHMTKRSVWSQQFPDGPPAHRPGDPYIDAACRCYIRYSKESESSDRKNLYKKILKQAQQRGGGTVT